jgi:putative salt-induced outer membrane protein
MRKYVPFVLVAVTVVQSARAEEPKKKVQDAAQLTFVSANGNTNSTTIGFSNEFIRRWRRAALEVKSGALGARTEGITTAERYFTNEKFQRNLTDRNYVFEKAGWERDRFAGIAHRWDSTLGLGRGLVKTERNDLILELGAGYVNEQRTAAPREDFASGRAYAKYVRILSETAQASQDAEYIHNFDDPDAYRLNAETALTASVNSRFSVKVSYALKRANDPPPGTVKNDTLTSAALIFNYP